MINFTLQPSHSLCVCGGEGSVYPPKWIPLWNTGTPAELREGTHLSLNVKVLAP